LLGKSTNRLQTWLYKSTKEIPKMIDAQDNYHAGSGKPKGPQNSGVVKVKRRYKAPATAPSPDQLSQDALELTQRTIDLANSRGHHMADLYVEYEHKAAREQGKYVYRSSCALCGSTLYTDDRGTEPRIYGPALEPCASLIDPVDLIAQQERLKAAREAVAMELGKDAMTLEQATRPYFANKQDKRRSALIGRQRFACKGE
jgi:hypothetical protein